MKLAHFFIRRPIFAAVISIVIVLLGIVSALQLPVDSYPDVVPPTIIVRCMYPGANADIAAKTVATPLEEEINGVEDMLYMSSACSSDGTVMITVTFRVGANIDIAQVRVQNRVNLALPRLPEEVRRLGIDVRQRSPSMIMLVNVISPDRSYNTAELYNFARLNLKDELSRVPGVGEAAIFGARDYSMRIWINPEKAAACGLTAGEIVAAIREQNIEVAAGGFGFEPATAGTLFQVPAIVRGRLVTPEEFGRIVVKTDPSGHVTYLKDIARIELGAQQYGIDTFLDGQPAVVIGIMKRPGANAVQTADAVRQKMAELAKAFPPGIDYRIYFDTTEFIRESIDRVIHTLIEAFVLVAIVVILFLQTWRASLIPLLAVPVSLVGTFTAMHAFGFTINNLTLFGLVLAIGIVVDDAIVVVENVERHMRAGLSSLEASFKAMEEVTSAVIAIGLVLASVFVPTAFIPGLEGRFYRQFALTIAVSTLISALVSITLTPALCALILRERQEPKYLVGRLIDATIGRFLRGFDRLFELTRSAYVKALARVIRHGVIVCFLYVGLLALTYFGYNFVPRGFIPDQDQGYLFAYAQLPDGASLERTREVAQKIRQILLNEPGVAHVIELQGFSLLQFGAAGNAASFFIPLKPFKERLRQGLAAQRIVQSLQSKLWSLQEAVVAAFNAPPVQGLGMTGGVKLQIQDRAGYGYQTLETAAMQMMGAVMQLPGVISAISTFRGDVPQVYIAVDREKARKMGIPLTYVWDTLQVYLASAYVNDFTLYGRPFQVRAQVDALFRMRPEQLASIRTKNPITGGVVPITSLVEVYPTNAPVVVTHYNIYPSADLTVNVLPFISSSIAMQMVESLAERILPPGMTIEWTEIAYLQKLAGNVGVYVLPFCILLVFLVLAALYESWSLPFAIILITPLCLLFALAGVFMHGISNNLFVQIGLVVLIGLAAKNAILVVEFARQLQEQRGMNRFEAALEAARLRLRPILMTSFAFTMGVVPLMLSRGAGREMHNAVGTGVFWGMLGVTIFGLFMTPVFYVIIRRLAGERGRRGGASSQAIALIAVAGIGCGILTGCAVGPKYEPPKLSSLPSHFVNGEQAGLSQEAVETRWWALFGDQKLARLVEEAAQGNHDVRIAVARLKEARALRKAARLELFPIIHSSASYTESLLSSARMPYLSREMREYDLYEVGFDATWELDFWGRVRKSVEAASALVAAMEQQTRFIQVLVMAEVARNYVELRSLQNQLSIVEEQVKSFEQTVSLTKAKLDAGLGREMDVAMAQAQLETVRAIVPQLERAIRATIYRISVLTGRSPAELEAELLAPGPLPVVLGPVKIGNVEQWLRRRPDIQSAERRLAAATAQIGVAIGDLFPRVTFVGTIGLMAPELSGLFDSGREEYSFGPRITWAAFDLGRVLAQIEASKARAEAALAEYEKTVLTALEETENALITYGKSREKLVHLRQAVKQAEIAFSQAKAQYEAGMVDFLVVLDAQRRLLELRQQLVVCEGELSITTVGIYKALGGGWEAVLNKPVLAAGR